MSARVLAIGLCVVGMVATAAAQGVRPGYLVFEDPRDRFTIEFPSEWNWAIITPSGEPIAMFEQRRSEAAFLVERFRSPVSLAPDEISELTADLEAGLLKEHQPAVTEVTVKIVNGVGRRVIVIDYTRPGLSEPERVRQYTFLMGNNVYRLSCFSLRRLFPNYLGVCESMSESFQPAGAPASSAR